MLKIHGEIKRYKTLVKDILQEQLSDNCSCKSNNQRVVKSQIDFWEKSLESSIPKDSKQTNEHVENSIEAIKLFLKEAFSWIAYFDIKDCDTNCKIDCEKLRKMIKFLLNKETSYEMTAKDGLFISDMLKLTYKNPRVVVCSCAFHLNTVAIMACLHMVQLASNSFPQIHKTIVLREDVTTEDGILTLIQGEREYKCSEIHRAVVQADIQQATEAIRKGVPVDYMGSLGLTALHVALLHKYCKMANQLLSYDADPRFRTLDNTSPLLIAIVTRDTTMFETLKPKVEDLFRPNTDGLSPILVALSLREKELFQSLITHITRLRPLTKHIGFDESKWEIIPPTLSEETKRALDDSAVEGATGTSHDTVETVDGETFTVLSFESFEGQGENE